MPFYAFFVFAFRDNFLVLDIFFEALNYETIEQKKAYDVAGLLGKKSACFSSILYNSQKARQSREQGVFKAAVFNCYNH